MARRSRSGPGGRAARPADGNGRPRSDGHHHSPVTFDAVVVFDDEHHENPTARASPTQPPPTRPPPLGVLALCPTARPLAPGWLFTAEALDTTPAGELWVAGWGHPLVQAPGASPDPPAIGVTGDGGATWEPLCWPDAAPPDGRGLAIAFRSSLGIVVGDFPDAPFVMRTGDGGATWQRVELPAPTAKCDFADVVIVDDRTVWLTGVGGVYHSRDGGRSFTRQALPGDAPCAFTGLSFVDADHGWLTGPNRVARTTDGGATWTNWDQPLPVPGYVAITDVVFTDVDRGFVATSRPDGPASRAVLFVTDDGGRTWRQGLEAPGIFRSLDFVDHDHGFLAGGTPTQGEIWATADGGTTWARRATLASRDIQVISFADRQRGYGTISNRPCIIATTDGGHTWTKTPVAGPAPDPCEPDA